MVNNQNVTLFTFHKNYMTKKNIPSILASGEKEMENFRSWALDLVDLLESPWSSWASNLTDSREATWRNLASSRAQLAVRCWLCTYYSVLEVSARLFTITWRKTRYPINKRQIPANGKFTKYSKCSLLAARNKNLTNARACKNKHTARMLANARKGHSILLLLIASVFKELNLLDEINESERYMKQPS